MTRKIMFWLIFLVMYFSMAQADELSAYNRCILEKTSALNEHLTIKEIREICLRKNSERAHLKEQVDVESAIQARAKIDRENLYKPFTIMAHKPNYMMPVAHNMSGYNSRYSRLQFSDQELEFDDTEAQFQLSIKAPLVTGLFQSQASMYVGYTNRSFWQLYNSKLSSPFRETNHEPEIWLQFPNDNNESGIKNVANMVGFSHQSNGRGGVLSRSWNRVYAQFLFEQKAWVAGLKIWKRLEESAAKDDNLDINHFMGHGEIRLIYKGSKHQTMSILSRNNLESGFSQGAVELSWSFPIGERKDFKAYIQLFSGYGESLIDYNQEVNRIGVGILLSDWL